MLRSLALITLTCLLSWAARTTVFGWTVTFVTAGPATGLWGFPFPSSGGYPYGSMNKINTDYTEHLANSLLIKQQARNLTFIAKQTNRITTLEQLGQFSLNWHHNYWKPYFKTCIKSLFQYGESANSAHSIQWNNLKICLITDCLILHICG
jgi:hypothetical protein